MVSRSLPERTVDAWVAASVCAVFPGAHIWGPTQPDVGHNWDYGLSLGNGKVFIFEDKATSPVERVHKAPLQTHRIEIDRNQLDWYCDAVAVHTPVYYVLARPPWSGGPTGSTVVPDQTICRTHSTAGPFEQWAYVIGCDGLRTYLGTATSVYTDTLPFAGCVTLSQFLAEVGACLRGRRVEGPGQSAATVAKGQAENVGTSSVVGTEPLQMRESPGRAGSALAIFIPAGNLPGFLGS